MKVKISIALKSFEAKQVSVSGPLCRDGTSRSPAKLCKQPVDQQFSNFLRTIALPTKQSNYTVLRSPHIDKKSREQFELKIHKQLIIISTEIKHIREKLFMLKHHEMTGIQMKIVFRTSTRLSCLK